MSTLPISINSDDDKPNFDDNTTNDSTITLAINNQYTVPNRTALIVYSRDPICEYQSLTTMDIMIKLTDSRPNHQARTDNCLSERLTTDLIA